MNMLSKKIGDKIKKESMTLKERGLHDGSYFEIEFSDNSKRSERDTSWHSVSKLEKAKHPSGEKFVMVCTEPIKKLSVFHNGKTVSVNVNKDERAYQSIKASTTFLPDGTRKAQIIGRVIGKIKDGVITEEYLIDDTTGEVIGFRN